MTCSEIICVEILSAKIRWRLSFKWIGSVSIRFLLLFFFSFIVQTSVLQRWPAVISGRRDYWLRKAGTQVKNIIDARIPLSPPRPARKRGRFLKIISVARLDSATRFWLEIIYQSSLITHTEYLFIGSLYRYSVTQVNTAEMEGASLRSIDLSGTRYKSFNHYRRSVFCDATGCQTVVSASSKRE